MTKEEVEEIISRCNANKKASKYKSIRADLVLNNSSVWTESSGDSIDTTECYIKPNRNMQMKEPCVDNIEMLELKIIEEYQDIISPIMF